jgi:hypothetical protein
LRNGNTIYNWINPSNIHKWRIFHQWKNPCWTHLFRMFHHHFDSLQGSPWRGRSRRDTRPCTRPRSGGICRWLSG